MGELPGTVLLGWLLTVPPMTSRAWYAHSLACNWEFTRSYSCVYGRTSLVGKTFALFQVVPKDHLLRNLLWPCHTHFNEFDNLMQTKYNCHEHSCKSHHNQRNNRTTVQYSIPSGGRWGPWILDIPPKFNSAKVAHPRVSMRAVLFVSPSYIAVQCQTEQDYDEARPFFPLLHHQSVLVILIKNT